MLHTGLWNIPKKSCTYPWSLRLPPVQSSRLIVGSPCSLPEFSPTMSWCFNMTLQVFAVMLCWMVLALACPETVPFALPCCLPCICFGAALDQTGYASNSALSVFFLCQLKCCNASKAHWSHVLSAFTFITISIWMSVCSVRKTEKRDTGTLFL